MFTFLVCRKPTMTCTVRVIFRRTYKLASCLLHHVFSTSSCLHVDWMCTRQEGHTLTLGVC